MKTSLLLLACASLAAGTAQARDVAEPKALLKEWQALNSACRGGHGDDPRTMKACARRDVVDRRIIEQGWCYGRPGEYEYQKTWRRCPGR